MNIFERASRGKLRFKSSVGMLCTEDLWDLPLTSKGDRPSLDNVARGVFNELKSIGETSFVDDAPNPAKAMFELQLEVVKHVIAAKKEAAENAQKAAEKRQLREKLQAAIAAKQEQALGAADLETLQKQLAELDAEG